MGTAKTKAPAPEETGGEQEINVNQEVQTPDPWEKVPIKLNRIPGGNDEEYFSVNNYSCIIPRNGKTYMVPRCVKKESDRSERAIEKMYENKDAMLDATRQAALAANMR